MNSSLLHKHNIIIVHEDFLLKELAPTVKVLPKFTKVSLSAKFDDTAKTAYLSLFEILSFHKPYLTVSRKNNLSLSLRKGDLVGCKIVLRKNAAYNFLDQFLLEVVPKIKNFKGFKKAKETNYLHYQIKDLFVLDEINELFGVYKDLQSFDIVIEGHKANSNFFKSFRFLLNNSIFKTNTGEL